MSKELQDQNTTLEQSNILSVLDDLGMAYTIKGRYAHLVEHDSLSIQLSGKYKDTWRRWSTGDYGVGANQLVQYLIQIGTIHHHQVEGIDLKGFKRVKVKKSRPFDYETMVTNPNPRRVKDYLINTRQLSPLVVERMFDLGKIVQDGRGNARFLWESGEGNFTGADVQGTTYIEDNNRGYIKYAVEGSKGLFFVKDVNISHVREAKHVYVFEAVIDLLSFLELVTYNEETRLSISEVLPVIKEDWVAFSLSGADAKIIPALQSMQEDFGIDLQAVQFHIATDVDEAGEAVYDRMVDEGYQVTRVKPNDGQNHMANQNQPLKDWNDLLKMVK